MMKATSETGLIEYIRSSAGTAAKSVIQSIGDDCAVVRPAAGRDLVFTSDFTLESRHFTLDTHTPAEIGHKALARSLSDLAAMGAEPLFCLVSLAIPAGHADAFVKDFYKGFLALARQHGITLAGGDLARFSNVIADVMCCGSVPKGKAFLRSAAKPGDSLYVTGTLGNSAHGFRTKRGNAWKRHKRPIPQIQAGLALRQYGVKCAMDLSDGLSLDLARLCTESNVGADLFTPLPVGLGATLREALHGGEDYELLFTAAPGKMIAKAFKIGTIVKSRKNPITLNGIPLPRKGFDHFA